MEKLFLTVCMFSLAANYTQPSISPLIKQTHCIGSVLSPAAPNSLADSSLYDRL